MAAHLQLPGLEPAQVDIAKLHELIREQPMSAMQAAGYYGLPPDVITYVLERGLEQEMQPPAWHGRTYRHKDAPSLVLPRQQISPQLFTQLYTDQRLSLGEIARRYGTTRFVIKRLAREYGITLRPHNAPQFVIGQEWLHEQYVVHKRSMSSIAKDIGMGDHIVLRWLIIYQIPRRPSGGASHHQAIMLRDEAQHVPDLLRPALTGTRGWKRLDNLVVLSGHANFQSAANSIGCHYTTLKDNIRQLETALGQRLVHRAQASRPLRLTDAGLALIQAIADFRQA